MAEEFLGDRKRAMEEEFFRKHEKALIERLRAERSRQTAREALAAASGVTDPAALDRLVALGIDPDTLLALRLVPLVAVAWADGQLDPRERQAVLSALAAAGVAPASAAYGLVQGWLQSPPPPTMLQAWASYASGLSASLPPAERATLRTTVMGQARAVAETAGGFLGVGKVSAAEEETLARMERALAG
jgi:hypothetical protein